jgi:RNA polymerase sigma-70 factor (ECF subfamily)
MGGNDEPKADGPPPPPDPESLGRAMESCRPYLLAMANDELGSDLHAKGGASDLVQETFLEAHRDRDRFQGRTLGELRAWLRCILLHNLSNFVRRYRGPRKRDVGHEVSLDQETPSGRRPIDLAASSLTPSADAIQHEQAQALTEALGRLCERDRLVVLWRNQERCPFEEIGRRLGGSAEMARKVWTRAVERLRDEVGGS